jgi:hypothetical protein
MGDLCLSWRAFHAPKEGHAEEEYEDAMAGDSGRGRFAVADGASESAFAASWAQILVRSYVETPGPWSAWLPEARRRWQAEVQTRELPWWAESKVEEGAFAALVGIAFHGRRWAAQAVGDSCLFLVRDDHLLWAFPIRRACDFGNRPSLVGSRRRPPGQARTKRFRLRGECRAGDEFYLMTDALAQWWLQQVEDNRRPWQAVQGLGNQEEFGSWLANLRKAREVRNDDVTLVEIQIQRA